MAVCEEGRTGRALKLCQLYQGAKESTWQTAMAAPSSATTLMDAGSQTELQWEPTAAQVPGRRVCLILALVWDSSSEHSCGRCTQVEQFLHLVTELQEEVSRLKSIRECGRKIVY